MNAFRSFLLLTGSVACLPCAQAESFNGSLDFEQRINGKIVLQTVDPIRARLQDVSAVFFFKNDVVIYGIVLTPDGYIATKASEFQRHKDMVLRIGSKKYDQFRLVGIDPVTDVALIKVDAEPIAAAPGPIGGNAPHGTIVVSNGSTTRTSRRAQLGVISANKRAIPNGDTAYIGLTFQPPCSVQDVIQDGPSAKSGLMPNDAIIAIDGKPVSTLDAIRPILIKKKIGDKITLKIKRDGKTHSYTITLGSRRQAMGEGAAETSNDPISGGFSQRRDDFPMVLQHDTPSQYMLMGGPLINLKGELIGMNIARVNRAENFALPIDVVFNSMKTILAKEAAAGKPKTAQNR